MAKLSLLAGTTSKTLKIFVLDSSKTTGAGLTGLTYSTVSALYVREGDSTDTAFTPVTATQGAWTSKGFVATSSGVGLYEVGIPNAALASGAKSVIIMYYGATNMVPTVIEIELTAVDNQNANSYGLAYLTGDSYGRLGSPAGASASADIAAIKAVLPAGTTAVATSGGLVTCDSTNSVKIQTPIKRNTALNYFTFLMTTTAGNAATGLTVTAQTAINGAAFVSCTNAPVEIAYGVYYINLAAADVNGADICLRFSGSGARDTILTLLTLP